MKPSISPVAPSHPETILEAKPEMVFNSSSVPQRSRRSEDAGIAASVVNSNLDKIGEPINQKTMCRIFYVDFHHCIKQLEVEMGLIPSH